MKNKVMQILISICVFVFGTWDVILGNFGKFVFAIGSDVDLFIISCQLWHRIAISVFFVVLLWFNFGLVKIKYCFILGTVLIFWVFSLFSVGVFSDGRVISGWTMLQFNKFNVCWTGCDCEEVIYYRTKIILNNPWSIRVKNDSVNQIVFSGPLLNKKAFHELEEVFPFKQGSK
jgi:hypothetical protein